jgi:hypothetical protein
VTALVTQAALEGTFLERSCPEPTAPWWIGNLSPYRWQRRGTGGKAELRDMPRPLGRRVCKDVGVHPAALEEAEASYSPSASGRTRSRFAFAAWVIATDEDLVIARAAFALASRLPR